MWTLDFDCETINRLVSVTQTEQSGGHAVAPKHATLEYDRTSRLTDLRRYSAGSASWSNLEIHSRREYDGAGRLVSITHGNKAISGSQTWDGTSTPPSSLGASGMLAAYRMDYDENHRLASLGSYADGFETSFGYDDRDQLTSATSAAISGLSQPYGIPSSESYDLDENGNRKSSGGQSQSDPDTHNQLQSDGTFNYTYDDEGNTLTRTEIASGEVTEYEWDHRNRLVRIVERTTASGSITQEIEYIYDAFDQRVGKRLDDDGNGTWDRDEAYIWTEGQTHLRLTDSDGEGTTETFHVASRYLYGDIVDHLLADEQFTDGAGPAADATTASTTAGETLWALVDHLGSVRDLVANGGVIREHVVYDSFGNRLVEQNYDTSGVAISSHHAEAVDSLFGYTGRDWDADAGLQYNRARWYDPATGRWLSQDPIGFDAGDRNLYRYVGNQPTTLTDPSGLEPPQLTPEEIDQIINTPPTIGPLVGPRGGISLGAHGNGLPAGSYSKPRKPSLTINFDYGRGFFDPINPFCESFGPLWGGYYQSFVNDGSLPLDASMSPKQWQYVTEILHDHYSDDIGVVQIVGHGNTSSGGPFNSTNIQKGPLRDFLNELSRKKPSKVYFRTCYTGSDSQFLQEMADILGAPVYAGDGLYAVWNWGDWWVAEPGGEGPRKLDD